MYNEFIDSASLVARSAYNHQRYIKPSSHREPAIYAGKVESAVLTLLLDIYGVKPQDIPYREATFRFCSAFNLQWRAYDEVLDEKKFTLETVTEEDLDTIPIPHKYMRREITGSEGLQIALISAREAIPGNDPLSKQRRECIEELLLAYRRRVTEVANNPLYHTENVLSFPLALRCKEDITGFLGEVGVRMYGFLLGLDKDTSTIELFRQGGIVMQFGDDYLDWRKDWHDHQARKAITREPIRPIENLLVATLEENPTEKANCEEKLTDDHKRSSLWLDELAPNTLDLFRSRFYSELDKLPIHPYSDKLRGIIDFTFSKVLPWVPESGRFFQWAKY